MGSSYSEVQSQQVPFTYSGLSNKFLIPLPQIETTLWMKQEDTIQEQKSC